MKYLLALVATVALTVAGAAAQQYPQNAPQGQQYPQNNSQGQQYPQNAPQGQQTVNVQNDTLPSGTQLMIRTDEQINADSQSVGQTYQAEIAQDIADQNGRVIIPRGAPARLTIANV